MADNKQNKNPNVPNLSFKREQSETCFDSAERVINQKQNVPNLRFPEFTEEWKTMRLGDTCEILMCKRIFANQTTEEGDIPFYKIGTIGKTPDSFISKELFEEYKSKYNYPRQGEVMITCAGTVGKAIVFNGEDSYYQDSNIVWIDNPTKELNNTFLLYKINGVDWSKLNSTTITRIYNDDLKKLKIVYPSFTEQTKIINVLQLLDDRIATQNKIIEDLKKLKVAICNKYLNKGEQSVKLGEIGSFIRGLTYSSNDINENQCGTIVLRSNNIVNGESVNFDDIVWVNKTPSTEQVLRDGDIVICMANGSSSLVGKSSYYSKEKEMPTTVGAFCGIFRPNHSVAKWLFQTTHYKQSINKCLQGGNGAIANVYPEDILSISFNIPSNIKLVIEALEILESKIIQEQKYQNRYTTLKSYLLQQMFI